MASAAEIGASFSNYTGNPNLGGGTLGVLNINTKPIEQLAQYTFFYNKAEYDQRQKDAEKAAEEIASMTNYDLSTAIDKDSKVLRSRYDALIKYAQENPDAINYRNENGKFLEYNKMKNELANDIAAAKVRNVTYQARLADIQKNTNKQLSALDMRDLMDEIEKTDIRTPLKVAQQFDVTPPTFVAPTPLKFDVYRAGENKDQLRTLSMPDVGKARAESLVEALDITKNLDPNTPEGERRTIARGQNFYTKGTDIFNSILKDPKYRDEQGNLDESKLSGVSKDMVDLIKTINTNLENTKTEIKSGIYLDKFDKPISFGDGILNENDFSPINYADGISPEELVFIGKMAAAQSISYETKTILHDNAIQKQNIGLGYSRIAEDKRQFDNTPHGGAGAVAGEGDYDMDLTGYKTGTILTSNDLTTADIASIDPSLVDPTKSILQLTPKAKKKFFVVQPDGSVIVYDKEKDARNARNGAKTDKDTYQRNANANMMNFFKERKGQEGNPYTNTNKAGQKVDEFGVPIK